MHAKRCPPCGVSVIMIMTMDPTGDRSSGTTDNAARSVYRLCATHVQPHRIFKGMCCKLQPVWYLCNVHRLFTDRAHKRSLPVWTIPGYLLTFQIPAPLLCALGPVPAPKAEPQAYVRLETTLVTIDKAPPPPLGTRRRGDGCADNHAYPSSSRQQRQPPSPSSCVDAPYM